MVEMVENAYEVARHATRVAWHRLGSPRLSSEDWDDLVQDSVLKVIEARPVAARLFPDSEDQQRAYVFGAARQAAINGYLRGLMAHNPATTVPLDVAEFVEVEAPELESVGLNDVVKAELEQVFRETRKQQQGRAVAAAKRDVLICNLLVRGYRNQGLSMTLGISVDTVKTYRRRIKAVLVREAVRRGVDTEILLQARQRSYGFVAYRVRSRRVSKSAA